MHTSNCIESAAFESVSTSFETPKILLEKFNQESTISFLRSLIKPSVSIILPTSANRLRQHQWGTSIHLVVQHQGEKMDVGWYHPQDPVTVSMFLKHDKTKWKRSTPSSLEEWMLSKLNIPANYANSLSWVKLVTEDFLWPINGGEVGWRRYSHSTPMAWDTS